MIKTRPAWRAYGGLKYQVTNYENGYIKVKTFNNLTTNAGSHQREKIKTFSDASRKRLLEKLMEIEFKKNEWRFVTCTIHEGVKVDSVSWSKIMKRFCINFERKYGKIPFVWKLEFQENGQPHLHLLVRYKFKREDYDRFRNIWVDSVHSGNALYDYSMRKASTAVERIKKSSGALGYFAKYIGKKEQALFPQDWTSRIWGIRYKDNINFKRCIKTQIKNEFNAFYLLDKIYAHTGIPSCSTLYYDESTKFNECQEVIKSWLVGTNHAENGIFVPSIDSSLLEGRIVDAITGEKAELVNSGLLQSCWPF